MDPIQLLDPEYWRSLALYFVIFIGIVFSISMVLLVWVLIAIKKINLPPDADFFVALRFTPLVVVVLIDLLDLSLDFLSAPVGWLILTRLGLGPLRGVSVVEGLVPGTQFIPTMTLAWFYARIKRS